MRLKNYSFLLSLLWVVFFQLTHQFVLQANAQSQADSQFPISHPRWKLYLHTLLAYQKSFPGIYTPIDLIRWDKIPQDWLQTQIGKYSNSWERLQKKSLTADLRRTEETVVSRKANEELYQFIQSLEKSQNPFFWVGSTRPILDSMSENERLSLTPLDAVFQESSLGLQLFDRIRERKTGKLISGFIIDKKQQRLILEEDANNYFKFEIKDAPSPQDLLIRTFYGREERVGLDIKIQKENFRGYLLKPLSNDRFPFGPMPLKKNQWVDERGHSHFEGDGHKH